MCDFSERHPLRVSEPQPGLELSFKDPVFGSKILITQKEFLVHCSGNVGQNTYPIHNNSYHRLQLVSRLYVSIVAWYKCIVLVLSVIRCWYLNTNEFFDHTPRWATDGRWHKISVPLVSYSGYFKWSKFNTANTPSTRVKVNGWVESTKLSRKLLIPSRCTKMCLRNLIFDQPGSPA